MDSQIVTPGTAERFWSKVNTDGECWEWQASKRSGKWPYGKFGVNGKDGGWIHAHRMSWMLEHGAIPEGKVVCHKCDNPSCVRPSHLFLGSLKDNTQDMIRKGRNNPGAKYDVRTIQRVKELRQMSLTAVAIAEILEISPWTVHAVDRGEQWAHVQPRAVAQKGELGKRVSPRWMGPK